MSVQLKHDLRLVLVEWEDIVGDNEWQKLSAARSNRAQACISVGFEIARHSDRLVLAATLGNAKDGLDASETLAIPLGCVQKITVLRQD